MSNLYQKPEGTTKKARQVLIDIDSEGEAIRTVLRCSEFDSNGNMVLKHAKPKVFDKKVAVETEKMTSEEVEQFSSLLKKVSEITITQ